MNGKEQKTGQDTYQQKDRAEPEGYEGGQTFIWMTEKGNANTTENTLCKLRNRRIPNGTYGGVRGRKIK
jgi:hypothetical protein